MNISELPKNQLLEAFLMSLNLKGYTRWRASDILVNFSIWYHLHPKHNDPFNDYKKTLEHKYGRAPELYLFVVKMFLDWLEKNNRLQG